MEIKDAIAFAKTMASAQSPRKNAKSGMALMMLDFYTTAIEALEKQDTMRATASFAKYYECPKCGELLETVEPYEYCWHCGQRISQSEGK